ncbi:MAG: HigA family addiction module antitoxin [Rhodobacteraceae bacterium]|nr:HigA family addiction module antitoxin [Paracoccaceae bacterium]MCY4249787.1 HigA family addiction module antitoxin [Paracoccaceae bacterium]MCY4308584.1 HigA family addiction module antitoxin [Paracoccaceae bacterium]
MTQSLLKDPPHPGEVLHELYLKPLEMSSLACARRLGVPRTRIERLVKGRTGITPDTALRLARLFNTSSIYWMNMQTIYEMGRAAKTVDISSIEPMAYAQG